MRGGVGVEVAAGPGVDLHGPGARGPDPLGVDQRLLVALQHRAGQVGTQVADGPFEERGLARAGGVHQVDRDDPQLGQPVAVAAGQGVVVGEHVELERDGVRLVAVLVVVLVR